MRVFHIYFIFIFFQLLSRVAILQEQIDPSKLNRKKPSDTSYIECLDSMFHIQTWVCRHQMNYRLIFTNDFKLVLASNKMNSLSLGFNNRYLDLRHSNQTQFQYDIIGNGQAVSSQH
jgi:hypothetical protein